jgi:signal transduction histidine kinase
VAAAALVLWLLRDALPTALSASPPTSAQRPVITGHPLLLAAQGATALCFFAAAISFSRQASGRRDELLRWLGPACVLAAFARVNYVLFPSLYSDWFYTGDLLRTGSYLLLLVGAAREISLYWSAQARLAVLDDRRRLSRELHDGVVQELSYIRIVTDSVDDTGLKRRIFDACDRGLDEARAAIDALGRPAEESLGYLLHRSAEQVAERHGGHVVVDLDDRIDADDEQRHALVRITREAVSNALRHGGAGSVHVALHNGDGFNRLVVRDDGAGFDTEVAERNGGYGLISMRDRAEAIPGSLRLDSAPGGGTTVEVTW